MHGVLFSAKTSSCTREAALCTQVPCGESVVIHGHLATVNEVCSRGLAYHTHCTYNQSAAAPSHFIHCCCWSLLYSAALCSRADSPPSRRVLCVPYNHAPCHVMQRHIRRMHACLAVTCPLHFWQNGLDLLRAAAVTRGSNGYRESQHRKLTLEKKILLPLMPGLEPSTFQSRVRRSNH